MSSPPGQRIFPLVLTPFERFMLLQDVPEHPSTFLNQIRLLGQVDRPAFEAAVEEQVERHPMLRAVVKPVKRKLPCWVLQRNVPPCVDWAEEGVGIELPEGERIDLTSHPGLRIWVRQGAEHADVVLQFHHAAIDGIGGHRFTGDLLASYGLRTAKDGRVPSRAPLEPDRLRTRLWRLLHGAEDPSVSGGAELTPADQARRRIARSGFRHLRRYFVRGVTPAAFPRTPRRGDGLLTPFPNMFHARFDKEQTRRLRLAGIAVGVTPNDVLAAALFETLRTWNRRRRPWALPSRIRILVPTDLRGRGDERAPAANFVSWVFLTRPARQCRDMETLLQGIRRDTAAAKHNQEGAEFGRALFGALSIPGLLPTVVRLRQRCFPTAVLTNVGEVTRRYAATLPREKGRIVAGNLILDEVTGVPPLEPRTRLGVGVTSYQRAMMISVRGDPRRFDEASMNEFLGLFVERINRFIDKHA